MRPIFALPVVLAVLTTVSCSQNPTVQETAPPAATSTTATPSETITPSLPAVFVEEGIAIKGADPVAYFTEGAYVPGSDQFTQEWGGATWYFASAENRDAFASSPEQYAPQYGGFCAWAVTQGNKAPIDPEAWEIVDGKLYLNYDEKIQAKWAQDIPGNIAKADAKWPEISAQ